MSFAVSLSRCRGDMVRRLSRLPTAMDLVATPSGDVDGGESLTVVSGAWTHDATHATEAITGQPGALLNSPRSAAVFQMKSTVDAGATGLFWPIRYTWDLQTYEWGGSILPCLRDGAFSSRAAGLLQKTLHPSAPCKPQKILSATLKGQGSIDGMSSGVQTDPGAVPKWYRVWQLPTGGTLTAGQLTAVPSPQVHWDGSLNVTFDAPYTQTEIMVDVWYEISTNVDTMHICQGWLQSDYPRLELQYRCAKPLTRRCEVDYEFTTVEADISTVYPSWSTSGQTGLFVPQPGTTVFPQVSWPTMNSNWITNLGNNFGTADDFHAVGLWDASGPQTFHLHSRKSTTTLPSDYQFLANLFAGTLTPPGTADTATVTPL